MIRQREDPQNANNGHDSGDTRKMSGYRRWYRLVLAAACLSLFVNTALTWIVTAALDIVPGGGYNTETIHPNMKVLRVDHPRILAGITHRFGRTMCVAFILEDSYVLTDNDHEFDETDLRLSLYDVPRWAREFQKTISENQWPGRGHSQFRERELLVVQDASGWPFRGFRSARVFYETEDRYFFAEEYRIGAVGGGIDIDDGVSWFGITPALPFLPIWKGLILNFTAWMAAALAIGALGLLATASNGLQAKSAHEAGTRRTE